MGTKLIFSTSTELFRLPAAALVFVTANGNYSVFTMADKSEFMLTLQLGQIERQIHDSIDETESDSFIRIGKSLIINRNYITHINVPRQKLILSDCRSFRHEVTASKEALKALRTLIEEEK